VPESGFFAIALEKFTQKIFVKKWERLNPSDRPLHLLYGATSLTMRIGQLLCAFVLSMFRSRRPASRPMRPSRNAEASAAP
jgi:hypothetical protein